MISHPIEPIYDKNSKILILGSFPSVKSRQECFYYAKKQNRFWKVPASLYDFPLPETVKEKKLLLSENNIALWDVIASCDIKGSSDLTITNVTPNNIAIIAFSFLLSF